MHGWRAIVSGERRGVGAALVRALLWVSSLLYRFVVGVRNRLYDFRLLPAERAPAPVISVGNITAGGTGKTPMVEWLCQRLEQLGRKPAIVSRGYRAQGGVNDEALLLAERLPNVVQIQHPDRVLAATRAVRMYDVDFVVLDDGFQHRRLDRDIDLVLIDATCPFGYGYLLPRGLLREPVEALRRCDIIAMTRCGLVSKSELAALRRRLRAIAPEVAVIEVVDEPFQVTDVHSKTTWSLESLAGRKAFAFCGIGNPAAFYETLRRLGVELCATHAFEDHHAYSAADLEWIDAQAASRKAQMLLTTHKDAVKLSALPPTRLPLRVLHVRARVQSGEEALMYLIEELVRETRPPETTS